MLAERRVVRWETQWVPLARQVDLLEGQKAIGLASVSQAWLSVPGPVYMSNWYTLRLQWFLKQKQIAWNQLITIRLIQDLCTCCNDYVPLKIILYGVTDTKKLTVTNDRIWSCDHKPLVCREKTYA